MHESAVRKSYLPTRWAMVVLAALVVCAAGTFTGPAPTAAAPPTAAAQPTAASTEAFSTVLTLTGHTSGVTVLAWSPDGQTLASATGGFLNYQSTDDTVRLWTRQGTPLAVLKGHPSAVSSLAWSPDGKILASGANDGTVRWWRRDGTPLKILAAPAGTVFALAWSPDSRVLAAGIVDSPTHNVVSLWKADGTRFKTLSTAYSGGKFYNLGWSPDGQYLVGGAVSYTEWRPDGTPVFSYPGCASCTPSWGFVWSPDSRRWAIGNESGLVQVFAVDGHPDATFNDPHGGVNALAWSPDGSLLAGGTVTLWSPDGAIQAAFSGPSWVSTLVWSPDGSWLAASNGASNARTGTIYLWNRGQKSMMRLEGHTAPVGVLAWSPDGRLLASGALDQTIRLWSHEGISPS